jgi:hypothetical protein
MNVGGLVDGGSGCRTETEVEGKTKGAADGGYATDNISAVDGTAVPGICGSMGGFDEDFVGTAVISSNGDGFVEKAVEFFDTNGFVITAGSNVDVDVEDGTDGLEEAFEGAAIVHNNESTESDFEENILDEESGKIVRRDIIGGSNQNKPG